MKSFQTSQPMTGVIIAFVILIIYIQSEFFFSLGEHHLNIAQLIFDTILLLAILLLFYRIKIVVNDDHLAISYGIGLIKTRIDIKDIESVTFSCNKWYLGWGVRLTKYGTIYNISCRSAIDITLKNKKRFLRIGTSKSAMLKAAIDSKIEKANTTIIG